MKKSVRIFDVFTALVLGLILFLPAIIISVLIKLTSEGPVLFIQERVGHREKSLKYINLEQWKLGRVNMEVSLLEMMKE